MTLFRASVEERAVVLCVACQQLMLEIWRLTLQRTGHEVLSTSSSNEALAICASTRIDAILIDGSVLDEDPVAEQIRQIKPEIPKILFASPEELRSRRLSWDGWYHSSWPIDWLSIYVDSVIEEARRARARSEANRQQAAELTATIRQTLEVSRKEVEAASTLREEAERNNQASEADPAKLPSREVD